MDEKKTVQLHPIAALSYVGILFLIPLLFMRHDPLSQQHAKQGMLLFAAETIASFIWWIPLLGWAIGIAVLVAAVYGFIQAIQGNMWEMPVLGKYAKQLKI
jgi:uncharacterized membrane protein